MCRYDHGRVFLVYLFLFILSYVLLFVCYSFFMLGILESALFGYRVGRCRCRDPNDRPLIEIIFLSFCHFLVLLSFDKYSAA